MPIGRSERPVHGSSGLDEEAEWLGALAILDELSLREQLELLLRFGWWVRDCRNTRLELLEFHKETVRRAMAFPFARPEP